MGKSPMSKEYRAIKINGHDFVRLRLRAKRKKVPYKEIIDLLSEGYDVFIPEMNRKTAHFVKKKLSKQLGVEVECYPSELNGMEGYLFKISWKKLLDME